MKHKEGSVSKVYTMYILDQDHTSSRFNHVFLSVCLCVPLYVCLSVSVRLSMSLFLCLFVSLSVSPFIFLSVCLLKFAIELIRDALLL